MTLLPSQGDVIAYMEFLGAQLSLLLIVFVLRRAGVDIYTKLALLLRSLRVGLLASIGFRIVYLYLDTEDDIPRHRFANKLAKGLRSHRILPIVIGDPETLLAQPLFRRSTAGIVLLITNVFPLSANASKKKRIEQRIVAYFRRGGRVILGHDAIYRRSGHKLLQRIAGGVVSGFRTEDAPVPYEKNVGLLPERQCPDEQFLHSIPDSMNLRDNEYLVGTWDSDVEFIYVHGTNHSIPLMTRRSDGRGEVFWLNSGDQDVGGLPPSLAEPAADILHVLGALITRPAPRRGSSIVA